MTRFRNRRDEIHRRLKYAAVGHNEVGSFNPSGQHDSARTTPLVQEVQYSCQQGDQILIDFVRDEFDPVRLRVVCHQPLDGRATENPCSGSRVEYPKSAPIGIDKTSHELGGMYRCEKEAVFFAVPRTALRDVPLANSVGKGSGKLVPARNRQTTRVGLVREALWRHTAPYHEAPRTVSLRDRRLRTSLKFLTVIHAVPAILRESASVRSARDRTRASPTVSSV